MVWSRMSYSNQHPRAQRTTGWSESKQLHHSQLPRELPMSTRCTGEGPASPGSLSQDDCHGPFKRHFSFADSHLYIGFHAGVRILIVFIEPFCGLWRKMIRMIGTISDAFYYGPSKKSHGSKIR
jgi:hypothetical protein